MVAKRGSKSRKVEKVKCPECVRVLVQISSWGSPGGAREWSGVVSGGLWWWPVVVVVGGGEKWCKVVPKGRPELIAPLVLAVELGGRGD